MTLPLLNNGTWEIAPFTWNVDAATNDHQCIGLRSSTDHPDRGRSRDGDTLALGSDDVLSRTTTRRRMSSTSEAANELRPDPLPVPGAQRRPGHRARLLSRGFAGERRWRYRRRRRTSLPARPRSSSAGSRSPRHHPARLPQRPGFRLTAWRIANDADERWGSCFYFLRPRVRTTLRILQASWYETHLSIYGALGLDTDQPVQLADHLPLRVRVRLRWSLPARPRRAGRLPACSRAVRSCSPDRTSWPGAADLRVQAWFDRTDLLASSRSEMSLQP
jgi:hypothetical protein